MHSDPVEDLRADMVVAGSGLAGLFAAVQAAADRDVVLVTAGRVGASNSFQAQGGIAAAVAEDDSPREHLDDTLRVGRGLCVESAVRLVVEEAPARIDDLQRLGVHFDGEPGPLELGLEAGHSRRRVLHAGGAATGARVIAVLADLVNSHPRIRVLEHARITGLAVSDRECLGVQALVDSEKLIRVRAAATVLATGGPCGLYRRTTNPSGATGEGIALAYLAGAQLADLEFVQFHPTAVVGHGIDGWLISEAVRGEGAVLLDETGRRFMFDHHPEAELAPRDVVAQAVRTERLDGHEVFISLAHLDAQFVRTRFQNLDQTLSVAGLDLASDPIPVAPAAHFMMGGVRTDLRAMTDINRLYACGEVACHGTHGANRLASNGLLECLVFAHRAVETSRELDPVKGAGPWNLPNPAPLSTGLRPRVPRAELGELLDLYAGVVRDAVGLGNLLEALPPLETSGLHELTARLLGESALFREESRGGHFRSDHPETRPEFNAHTGLRQGSGPQLLKWAEAEAEAGAVVPQ